MDMKQIYSKIVMAHANRSDYHKSLTDPDVVEAGHNPSCGDEIELQLKLEGDRIVQAAFTGHGCAISQASTSLMCELIEGESLDQARQQVSDFLSMIRGEKEDLEELEDSLGDAVALQSISYMPQRVKCAELAWHTLGDLIKEREQATQGGEGPQDPSID